MPVHTLVLNKPSHNFTFSHIGEKGGKEIEILKICQKVYEFVEKWLIMYTKTMRGTYINGEENNYNDYGHCNLHI